MCQRVTCRHCGKATYSGCGMHVEQVLAAVPQSQRCQGDCAPDKDPSAGLFSLFRKRRDSA